MGMFGTMFGGKSKGYSAKNAMLDYQKMSGYVNQPALQTDTRLSKAETPKMAEMADTSEYDEAVARRRAKNGVAGSFGFTGAGDVTK